MRTFGPRLIIPETFTDCLSYSQQVLWLMEHKSPLLAEGENITLTENSDGTITISSTQEAAHTYSIDKVIHVEPVEPSGSVTWYEYKLLDENNIQQGDSIRVDDPSYNITQATYTDGGTTGTEYKLIKNGYSQQGSAIRVPNVVLPTIPTYEVTKTEYSNSNETGNDYKLIKDGTIQQGQTIRVPNVEVPTYNVTKTPYTDGTVSGNDYKLIKDEAEQIGETIRVPEGGQGGGGLYTYGGELIGASSAMMHPDWTPITMEVDFFAGNAMNPTIITGALVIDGTCCMAWDNRNTEPYNSRIFCPVMPTGNGCLMTVTAMPSGAENTYQFRIRAKFDGILDIPEYTHGSTSDKRCKMLCAYNMGNNEVLTYCDVVFKKDTTENKTIVSAFCVYPTVSGTISALDFKGLTFFN